MGDTDTVPVQFLGSPFLAGAVFNDFVTQWNAPGVNNFEARFNLAVNTCNGRHSVETGTTFLQISPRFPGNEASLSGFLTGGVSMGTGGTTGMGTGGTTGTGTGRGFGESSRGATGAPSALA